MTCKSHPDVRRGSLCMRALYLPVIGFGNWGQMEKRQRAQGLAMALLEALTGAMKNVVVPAPPPPLPEAAAGTAATRGTETETETVSENESEIGIGIETKTETGNETESGSGIGTETESGTETETESGTAIGTESERALSAGQIPSLNAEPLGRGILSMCMEKT